MMEKRIFSDASDGILKPQSLVFSLDSLAGFIVQDYNRNLKIQTQKLVDFRKKAWDHSTNRIIVDTNCPYYLRCLDFRRLVRPVVSLS